MSKTDLNVLVLRGRATKEAEIKQIKNGYMVKTTIATGLENGMTSFIPLVYFQKNENEAKFIADCIIKGSKLKAECEVINNDYTKEDKKYYNFSFIAKKLEVE